MMMKTLLATLCVIALCQAEQSPVFLWGFSSPAKPTLPTVTQGEFAKVVAPLLKDHMVVAFQETGLSTNDFLCANAKTALSCYAHLQSVPQKTYYASVENPTAALRSVSASREFNSIDKSGQLETPLKCESGKVVIVSFDNGQNERTATLEAHDAAIARISRTIDCPTTFMYMSAPSTVAAATKSRVRRATSAPNGGYMFHSGAQFRIFFNKLYVRDTTTTTEIVIESMNVMNVSESLFSVALNTGDAKAVTFDITLRGGYYYMVNVMYDDIKYFNNSITSPTTFSYHCGNLTLTGSTDNNKRLLWNSLQFQAPFGHTLNPDFVFGESWDCVGFFSPGILSGLFVVTLMLLITFVGVCWMMDINTMDRFDDPKGKTITINAGE